MHLGVVPSRPSHPTRTIWLRGHAWRSRTLIRRFGFLYKVLSFSTRNPKLESWDGRARGGGHVVEKCALTRVRGAVPPLTARVIVARWRSFEAATRRHACLSGFQEARAKLARVYAQVPPRRAPPPPWPPT